MKDFEGEVDRGELKPGTRNSKKDSMSIVKLDAFKRILPSSRRLYVHLTLSI